MKKEFKRENKQTMMPLFKGWIQRQQRKKKRRHINQKGKSI